MILETYSQSHMRAMIRSLGISVVSETSNDFLCLCPFHGNRNTPSFSVSHTKGLYICFNPSCGVSGTIVELVKELSQRNDYEALRFIISMQQESAANFESELAELLEDKPEFEEFSQDKLDELYNSIDERSIAYFESRGITQKSIDHFKLGYSKAQDMVIVPIHSPDGMPVGLVGRSIEGKSFKNSTHLPRSKTMFNLHRAKREGGTIIIVESSFDAIRFYEAGFPNAVATLGGHLSNENIDNLNKFSSRIIIATDADEAGRKLGREIAYKLKNKDILWASYDNGVIYPHGAKDIGDMTNEEIRQCIDNAVTHFEYLNALDGIK
jgi:DNA primase